MLIFMVQQLIVPVVREGVAYGYLKARKEVANLFQKHLNYSKKSDKPNKNQDKALAKFENFINLERGEDGGGTSDVC